MKINFITLMFSSLLLLACSNRVLIVKKNESGIIVEKFQCKIIGKDTIADGSYRSWYPNGNTHRKVKFKNGNENGKSKMWYSDGKKWISTNFVNGKENGMHTEWYENGQKWVSVLYINGLREGKQIQWYDNGNLLNTSCFTKGVKQGLELQYYVNGGKHFEQYNINNKEEGYFTFWEDKVIGGCFQVKCKNGLYYGLGLGWHDNGVKKSECLYENDKKQGWEMKWYNDGSPEYECFYVDGKKHGIEHAWSQTGIKIIEADYKNGDTTVPVVRWYDNGSKWSEHPGREGTYRAWHVNGNLNFEVPIVNGQANGIAIEYNEKGEIFRQATYVNGEKVKTQNFSD